MRERITAAFDAVRAEENLKQKTRDALARRLRRGTRPRSRARLAVALACLCLVCAGGCGLYFTPTVRISLDINPSIELSVNCFNRVIGAAGYNADGQALLSGLKLQNASYAEAVDRVLAQETVVRLMSEGGRMTIAVVGPEGKQRDAILTAMEARARERQNISCCAFRTEEAEEAHDLGFSYGKYRTFLDAQALDPELTPQEAQSMSMRELWELIESLSDCKQTQEDGRGSGHGLGHGKGWHGAEE